MVLLNLNKIKFMPKSGVCYYDEDNNLVKEKLMVMRQVSGTVSVEEANYSNLSSNISELYQWSKQGKAIYKGWIKIFSNDNALEDICSIIRNAKSPLDCQNSISSKYGVSQMSAEALVNISLSQLTSLSLDESTKMYEYYSLAEKQLKALLLK